MSTSFVYQYRGFIIRSYQFRNEIRYRITTRRPINRRYIHGWDTSLHRCRHRCNVFLYSLGVKHLGELHLK